MKTIFLIFIFSVCSILCKVEAQQIETDYLEARSKAKEQKKGLLYLFINDYNSRDFKRNFLKSSSIKSLESNFVILRVNCSSNKDVQPSEIMYCRRLTMSHNPDEIFPAVLATNKKFQPVGELQDNFTKLSSESYFKFLNSL